jgi:hypothetical protein
MKLNDFATILKAENAFIKASFGGFAGSGKTRTASELIVGVYKKMEINKPLLIIDNEKGSRFLIPFFESHNIKTYVKETVYLADVLDAFKILQAGELGFLFIDSLTKVWYQYVRGYKEKNKRVFMTLQDWGKILPAWQESFADEFVNLSGNCVFTGRGGYTYDMEENEETHKKEFIKSGVKMKMAGETPFEPDINVWMEISQEIKDGKPLIWREGLVMKDRSGLIDGKTFINPTFKDFEPVIDYLLKVEKGEVSKATNTENIAPFEIYSDKKERREIILEKVKNEFDKRQIGTSANDKAIKVIMLEKSFGTASATELEKLSIEKLQAGQDKILEMFVIYDQSNNKLFDLKNYNN